MRFAAAAAAIVISLLFAASMATGAARSHATPTPSPTPVADPAMTKLATQQFVAWQAGIINKHLYADQVLAKLTDERIADTSRALGQLGALTDAVFIGPWADPSFPAGARGYIYQMRCVEGNVYLWLAIDATGKIATIFFHNRLDVETVTASPSPPPP
jgi:hypothetical protein